MKRFFLALVLLCVTFAPVYAQQIKLDPKHHIENVSITGYCGHCCIETITLHHGFPELKGHVARSYKAWGEYGGPLHDEDACYILQKHKIAYYWLPAGTRSFTWLEYGCKNGYPSIVTFAARPGSQYSHDVVVTGIIADYVYYFDCNDVGKDQKLARKDFNERWIGNAIMIYNWYSK